MQLPTSILSPKKHIILTGPIQSGKTSQLLQWANLRKDVYGILTPIVHTSDGAKRVFMDIQTHQHFAMEANATEIETGAVLSVGCYVFSKTGFEKAEAIVCQAIQTCTTKSVLLIDEIGPLELRGEGLAKTALWAAKRDANPHLQVVWVVRESLVEEVKNRFLDEWLPDELAVINVQVFNKNTFCIN